jgi:IS30 family transposase
VGDWEVDTLVGKGHQGGIIAMVERKSCFTVLAKVEKVHADEVKKQIVNALAPYKDKVYTLTSDNGMEFVRHAEIAQKLHADFYFTHPYAAWQKGLCENTIGLIRQYIPKSSRIKDIPIEQLVMIAKKLNKRPRRNLNWKTPMQIFMANFTNKNVALHT